jgi:drug/metabolite transporter (DMT)-like permease
MLLLGLIATGTAGSFPSLLDMPLLVVAQALSASAMFAVYFRLQAVGGPVYLRQIGYVAAAIGLASGVVFLGEHYQFLTWIGAVITVIGVVLTTKGQAERRSA